jgi:hypothetical protein
MRAIARSLDTTIPLGLYVGFSLCVACLTTWLAIIAPLLAAALVYVVVFLALAWVRPQIALMLVVIAAPFQNDLSGGGFAKFSLAEINLVLCLPVFLVKNLARKRPLLNGPILVPVLAYFGVCLYSSWVHWLGKDAVISLLQMTLYLWIAVAIFASFAERGQDLKWCLYGIAITGMLFTIAEFATGFSFIGIHKNGAGASLACCTLVSAELWFASPPGRRRMMLAVVLAVTAAGLLYSISRGAWMGTGVGLAVIVGLRREYGLLVRGALLLIPLIAVLWYVMPQDSKDYATGFSPDRANISARINNIAYARELFHRSPTYGMGVGLRKEHDATNLVLFTLAETGVLGLGAFLWVHVAAFRMIWKAQRFIERTDPLFSCLAVGAALVADKFVHGLVDHYWSRGALMMAWSAFGMATGAYYAARSRMDRIGVKI